MAVIEYWIQIENRRWDSSPGNIDRMTGRSMLNTPEVAYTPTSETLNTLVPGSASRNVTMFNPIRLGGKAVDALILRRYKPPQKADKSDAWTVPDDRKINPWDLNERDPGENGTRGTIPGPTLELSVGDSLRVIFKNADFRNDWDAHARTHSLHPHGVVFEARYDGAFPLSPPDTAQPTGTEAPAWAAVGVTGKFKQGDRVPPGGTFTYEWQTVGWPTTAGVWLYHDHSINDMDNVHLGAIGMIHIHNPNDNQDVDVRLLNNPSAPDPALMPGGSPNGSPVVQTPIIFPPFPDPGPLPPPILSAGPISPSAAVVPPLAPAVGNQPPADPSPIAAGAIARDRAIDLAIVGELSPDLTSIGKLLLKKYRIPPPKEIIMQLYHQLTGIGLAINGRSYLGSTPTIVAGTNTRMRFGLVGMGTMFHTFHLHGHRWILPGPHGTSPSAQQFSPMDTPVSQFEDTRTFGPANSFVFTIDEASGSFMRAGGPGSPQALGEWHMHCHVLDHMMLGMMGSLLIVVGGEIAAPLPKGLPPGLPSGGGGVPVPKQVQISGFSFVPKILNVKMGDKVTWLWDNPIAHSVTSTTPADSFDSGVTNGPKFEHVFTMMGDFNYECVVHGSAMSGTIKVTM
ncbi:MAG TPA: multicopper oxidase domain-containing protein [Solirubrobacteraceae bacterium]|jgi:plastocyanin/FtsP/CotA-like multicopper oxidase with cupredoxin domain|nr:multicopper oxidase domain-containing protein [Solirubrobacteraceae bacterium]